MKTNTGLGGTALPPFKVGMGAIPSFQGQGSAIPMISNVGMGASCGIRGGCGCGGDCGMGAISKKQVNAPLRLLIILFFKTNIGGLATKFQNAGIGDDKLGRWFTELGGDGRELWAAIREGSSKPAVAKWFTNSIRNLTIRLLRKNAGIRGYGIGSAENPQSETTEEPNNTPYVNYEDIVSIMSSSDKQGMIKALCTTLGASVIQLVPSCAADPTGAVKTACAVGGGAVGYALSTIYNEIVRALFPKPPAPPKLEWSTLKPIIDGLVSFEGKTIDNTTKQACVKFPNNSYNNFPCKFLVGKTTYDKEVMTNALMIYYLNASNTSNTLASQFAEYLRSLNKGMGVVEFHDKKVAENSAPLPKDNAGGLKQAGAGLGIAVVGVIALLALSAGKKGKR